MVSVRFALYFCCIAALGCTKPVEEIRRQADASNSQAAPIRVGAEDWPTWRGVAGDGQATGALPPTSWSKTENVLWKVDVPGEGHASPTVCGDTVYVLTAEEAAESCLLLAYDRASGERRWQTELHQGGLMAKHPKNSHASATPACDGEHVFVALLHDGALWVSAVELDGAIAWQSKVGPFSPQHGYGASPVLYKSTVIVAGDNAGSSYLAALDRASGEIVWRVRRGEGGSYGTPVVADVAGKKQLLLAGQNVVTSYDPDNGAVLWTCAGPSDVTGNTMAWKDDLVFASGGYPQQNVLAIRADGSGDVTSTHIVWEKQEKAYVPSPTVVEDRLLVTRDNGILNCYRAATGDKLWSQRLGGNFSASPTIINGVAYVPNEDGTLFVFRPGETYEKVAVNDLGDGGMASPVIAGGRLFLRTDSQLFCIGAGADSVAGL